MAQSGPMLWANPYRVRSPRLVSFTLEEEVSRNERRQVRVTAVSGVDDATVGATDWKGFGKQDWVGEVEDVKGAGE